MDNKNHLIKTMLNISYGLSTIFVLLVCVSIFKRDLSIFIYALYSFFTMGLVIISAYMIRYSEKSPIIVYIVALICAIFGMIFWAITGVLYCLFRFIFLFPGLFVSYLYFKVIDKDEEEVNE